MMGMDNRQQPLYIACCSRLSLSLFQQDEPSPMMPKPWLCPRRPIGLSSANHSYAHFGLTTDVVREPLSTYTPLKYQSSAPLPSLPCRGSLRTPKCQSAPLLDVLVENGPAVLTSELSPVECQKVTWLVEKFCIGQRNVALHRHLQLTIS